MASSYTPLLGLVLPVTGELAGTWGTVWNNEGTSLLDSSIAGTTTLSTDADVTLTTTTGGSNQARQAILRCTGARTAQRTITAPAQSKIYAVVNNTTGGFAVKIVGVGPTTGVTVANGKTSLVIWNGSDFVEISPALATAATNLAGGAAGSLPYQTAAGTTGMLAIGANYRVLTSSGTAPQWSTEIRDATLITSIGNISARTLTVAPLAQGPYGSYTAAVLANATATVAIGNSLGGGGSTTLGQIFFLSGGTDQRASLTCVEEASGSAAYLAFATRDATALSERMRITSGGNVGIGTNAPNAALHVAANVSNAEFARLGVSAFPERALRLSTFTNGGYTNTGVLFNAPGATGFESTTPAIAFATGSTERMRIDSSGNVLVTSVGGLGYGTGSGGAVTQITSRTTGVTLNKTNGAITLFSAAGTATWQSFTVTNSTVAVTDTVIVNQKSGTDLYMIHVTNVSAGSFKITFATTGGTTTEQPVFNFAVIKAVTA